MLAKVKKYIDKYGLLHKGRQYLVALSGGTDSVALLRVLIALGYSVEAAHCNFRLRGEESDRDETFCRGLCRELGVDLHVAHFDTATYASLHGVSIEMAARELRYNYFFQLLADLNLEAVCVAHHRDDSVETVLLNMIRGTGVDGLKGIVPVNAKVIRPLLCVTRCELKDYLLSVGQDYIIDSSNLVPDVQRNKVRLEILPELERINPAVRENIARMSEHMQGVIPLIDYAIGLLRPDVVLEDDATGLMISIPRLMSTPSPQCMLWYLLRDKGFSSAQVTQVYESLNGQSGRGWTSSEYELLIDRDRIIVAKINDAKLPEMRVPECGNYVYSQQAVFSFSNISIEEAMPLLRNKSNACLDASKVSFPLVVRPVRNGDVFIPYGMNGRKLLSDYLTDCKFSLFEKRRQLVVTDSDDNIVWVVNQRVDNRYCVTQDTQNILFISFKR